MKKSAYIDGFISTLEKNGFSSTLLDVIRNNKDIADLLHKEAQGAYSPGYAPLSQTGAWQDFKSFSKDRLRDTAKGLDHAMWGVSPGTQLLRKTNYLGAGDPWTFFTEPFTGAYSQADKIRNTPLRWASKAGIGVADLLTYAIPYYNVARLGGQGLTAAGRTVGHTAKGNYGDAAIEAGLGALSIIPFGVGKGISAGIRQGVKGGLRRGIVSGAQTGSMAAKKMIPNTIKGKLTWGALMSMGRGNQMDDVAGLKNMQNIGY